HSDQGLRSATRRRARDGEEPRVPEVTPEELGRPAGLHPEKRSGFRTGDANHREMAAPKPASTLAGSRAGSPNPAAPAASARIKESDQDFERRTTAEAGILAVSNAGASPADTVRAGDRKSVV